MKILKSPKTYIALALLIIVAVIFWKFPVQNRLLSLIQWIRIQGTAGYLAYILVYAVGTVLLFPGSLLTLGAGFAWGLVLGTILVSVASMTGATASFLIGRYFARDWVAQKVSKYPGFQRIDRAVTGKGFKIVFLTRLSPVFPFTLQNYAYGLTGVSLRDYFFASWIGMLPGTIMYVYIGTLITEFAQLASGQTTQVPAQKILYVIGLIVTIFVTIYITRIAQKALKEGAES